MELNDTLPCVKGIIFAGCSFTWGQGLYYYSNLPTLEEPAPDQYDPELVKETHKEFMKTIRYPRLVANHFKSFELVHPRNGGSNHGAVTYWRECFTNRRPGARVYSDPVIPIDFKDIGYLVFQLTQWQRNNFIIEHKGERYDVPYHEALSKHNTIFLEWLENQNKSLEDFTKMYLQQGIDEVKQLLMDCEGAGIKTLIFTWPSDYIPLICDDPWLKERLITFDYNGKNYASIEELMWIGNRHNQGPNPELTIKWDFDAFANPPKDHHPSAKCHRVMAENIIKRIEGLDQ
jgi:hypothetical protein